MKITISYEISNKTVITDPEFDHLLNGPLMTGLDAANAQLEAENANYQLKPAWRTESA